MNYIFTHPQVRAEGEGQFVEEETLVYESIPSSDCIYVRFTEVEGETSRSVYPSFHAIQLLCLDCDYILKYEVEGKALLLEVFDDVAFQILDVNGKTVPELQGKGVVTLRGYSSFFVVKSKAKVRLEIQAVKSKQLLYHRVREICAVINGKTEKIGEYGKEGFVPTEGYVKLYNKVRHRYFSQPHFPCQGDLVHHIKIAPFIRTNYQLFYAAPPTVVSSPPVTTVSLFTPPGNKTYLGLTPPNTFNNSNSWYQFSKTLGSGWFSYVTFFQGTNSSLLPQNRMEKYKLRFTSKEVLFTNAITKDPALLIYEKDSVIASLKMLPTDDPKKYKLKASSVFATRIIQKNIVTHVMGTLSFGINISGAQYADIEMKISPAF